MTPEAYHEHQQRYNDGATKGTCYCEECLQFRLEFMKNYRPQVKVGDVLVYEDRRFKVKTLVNQVAVLREVGVVRGDKGRLQAVPKHDHFGHLDESKTKLALVYRDLNCGCNTNLKLRRVG